MSEPRTVTVRIPLVINQSGQWIAEGRFDSNNLPSWMTQAVRDHKGTIYCITAEVPVPDPAPAPTEIAGRAEPAEG